MGAAVSIIIIVIIAIDQRTYCVDQESPVF